MIEPRWQVATPAAPLDEPLHPTNPAIDERSRVVFLDELLLQSNQKCGRELRSQVGAEELVQMLEA